MMYSSSSPSSGRMNSPPVSSSSLETSSFLLHSHGSSSRRRRGGGGGALYNGVVRRKRRLWTKCVLLVSPLVILGLWSLALSAQSTSSSNEASTVAAAVRQSSLQQQQQTTTGKMTMKRSSRYKQQQQQPNQAQQQSVLASSSANNNNVVVQPMSNQAQALQQQQQQPAAQESESSKVLVLGGSEQQPARVANVLSQREPQGLAMNNNAQKQQVQVMGDSSAGGDVTSVEAQNAAASAFSESAVHVGANTMQQQQDNQQVLLLQTNNLQAQQQQQQQDSSIASESTRTAAAVTVAMQNAQAQTGNNVKSTRTLYYNPALTDGIPNTVYDASGKAYTLASLQSPTTEIYLQRTVTSAQQQQQAAAAPQQERQQQMSSSFNIPSWSNDAATGESSSPQTQDQFIIVATVATMALLVGALSARRLRSSKHSCVDVCLLDNDANVQNEVAYDAAYTTSPPGGGLGQYDTFGSSSWKGDLEKFDV